MKLINVIYLYLLYVVHEYEIIALYSIIKYKCKLLPL